MPVTNGVRLFATIRDIDGGLNAYHKSSNRLHGGIAISFEFPNGYGASVVSHEFSYGGKNGSWEVAVIGPDGSLDYTTPITDDVIGWLSEEEVVDILRKIFSL
jgi:hypothetical protein